MTDLRALARHLRDCRTLDRAPRIEVADAKLWYLALTELIRRGALSDAAHAAPHLVAAFPGSVFIVRLAMLLARMPPAAADPDFAAFIDRSDAQVQIVPCAGATTVLLAFCGRHGSLGMPIPIAHRWFGQLGVHVVYLRDPTGYLYVDGLPALAANRTGTVDALRAIADRLRASRLICYGNSNGGFAALLYALELPAHSVLVTNAVTIFPTDRMVSLTGGHAGGCAREDLTLAPAYIAASVRPRVRFVYGAENAADAASAAAFSAIEGVTIEAVEGWDDHDAHAALIERGRFGPLLREFVAGWPADEAGGIGA